MKRVFSWMGWLAVAGLGAAAYAAVALRRAEPINSAYLLVAALCSYALGYRFYATWVAARALALDDRRATPCERHDDGKDFVRTNPWIVFGHHFAAISGPGPLVGPVLAAQFGYLPSTLWILIGCVVGGAVQDFVVLFCSVRRDGRSLGQMVKDELNPTAGYVALAAILAIMLILLAVLALVVVKVLADSPWGVFTVGASVPIAMLLGGYLRWWRIGKVLEGSALGVVLLLLAVWGGQYVHGHAAWRTLFTLHEEGLAWALIAYGLAASVLPVWLLLAPRDYLSTFMKLGTIFALAAGVFLTLPNLKMPALSRFLDGSGLVVAGRLFPFCFITIACGAISGFHSLIASGTTPKLVTRERYLRRIGYGAMCLESLVAIMALIAACILEPGVYLSINVKGTGATPAAVVADTVQRVSAAGFPVTATQMTHLARQMGEESLCGRTGGAATLAVGMAQIFARVTTGRWLDLWYHFAIMFEALFILTTLDAGTRVGRYILQDLLGNVWRPLGETGRLQANLVASGLMVAGWGYFLIQGVRDPLGGINSLWPLFGIANQMLAAIALCLATTVILKTQLTGRSPVAEPGGRETALLPGTGVRENRATVTTGGAESASRAAPGSRPAGAGRVWWAWVTLAPLVWLLAVTFTAGVQKIAHPDPRIGFLAQARALDRQLPSLEAALAQARANGARAAEAAAAKVLAANRTLRFNNLLDAVVAGVFLALVGVIVLLSAWEWFLLLAGRRGATLRESAPVWLPGYAAVEGRPVRVLGLLALVLTLVKEWSGEATIERAQAGVCAHDQGGVPGRADRGRHYAAWSEERYRSPRRCC